MEYEDELERMRARRSNQGRPRSQNQHTGSKHKEPSGREKSNRKQYDAEEVKRYRIQQKKKKRKRRILMAELVVLVFLLGFSFWFFKKKDQDGYWTIAVFGVDSRDGNLGKGALADVQMICNIDRKTGEVKLVSVFRDTYLKINTKGTYHKINEAYFKGGPDQAKAALNENLDLNIDDYATFNWKTVAQVINILGGIDLEITDREFSQINGFITETVNSTGIGSYQLKNAGMNHLDGVQAVAYSRLRLMDTDFNRTERQRKVVSLALEKAKQADFATLNNILVTVLPEISTSIGIGDLIPMAKTLKDFNIVEATGFPFARTTTKIGKLDCVIPLTLESNVSELHRVLFGTENYIPSSTVKKISKKVAEDSGFGEEGKITETSGNKNQNSSKPTASPTKEQETTPEEMSSIEETTQEETQEETTEKETKPKEQETEKPTNSDGSLVGPGAEPNEGKPSSGKPGESKPGESKPTESKPAESKPAESKPAESKPAESKPAESKPVETAPPETKSNANVQGPGAEVGPGV